MDLRVGICSWTDRTLLASDYYPRSARDGASRLAHLAGEFSAVEVDSTFYALPRPENAYLWSARTPAGFRFGVKAFGLFTFHGVDARALPAWGRPPGAVGRVHREDLEAPVRRRLYQVFLETLEPLRATGKLGYLLFQFPPSFRPCPANLAYLRRVREHSGSLPLAVEVRHRSWTQGRAYEELLSVLRGENMAYVGVDEPDLPWTVPPLWPESADWGTLVRFHGRNVPAWKERGASVQRRFDYLYRDEELRPWRDEALRQGGKIPRVYLMFNNCVGDQAVRGARRMKALLGLGGDSPRPEQGTLGLDGE